jgi:polyferredoxin
MNKGRGSTSASKVLRYTRITLAVIFAALITLLFLDFTGTLHACLGWMAKIQLVPALLALNVGVIIALILLTLLFGRIYCSVICPLGVFQDFVSWLAGKRKRNRFKYSAAISWLRYTMLALFIIVFLLGFTSIAALIDPYSAYGRIATNIFSPIYQWGNNLLALLAERMNSYAIYSVDVWLKSGISLAIALITLVVVAVLAWRNGRTYCNTICPVGTFLGLISRFSLFKPVIDTNKCNGCKLCSRNCKASCINSETHTIDYSRCVVCLDCLGKCKQHALSYAPRRPQPLASEAAPNESENNSSRRAFLSIGALIATGAVVKAQKQVADGTLAAILDKKAPKRATHIVPPGSHSERSFAQHCTACQLCVSACPNQVLRPSSSLSRLMQPEMSYERGYCRPECVACSTVCPSGAIHRIAIEDKVSTQIGHAVWIKENCIVNTDNVSCHSCERHCPVSAIQLVPKEAGNPRSLATPVVDTTRCIGCGACENLCPARPYSAIYVEGHEEHKTV